MRAFTAFLPLGLLIASACPSGPALAAEAVKPYPTTEVLDAFRTACSELGSLAAAEAKVSSSGWTRAADPDATPVGELLRFGMEAGKELVEGRGKVDGKPGVYSREVAGEKLYLILSAVELGEISVTGCRAYDPDEDRKIEVAEVERWMGRAPDQTIDRAELTRFTWEPGLLPGQDSFEIFRVPAGSPVIAITKLSGIAFKADQVGTVQR